jgi:TonB family protein
MKRFLAFLSLACIAFAAQAELAADVLARILAGRETAALGQSVESALHAHSNTAEEGWREYERRIGAPLREWAARELDVLQGETVFYPFAGPDFPTVSLLYPGAGRYLLVANQYANRPPQLDRIEAGRQRLYLAHYARRWVSFGKIGFFRTDDLDAEAARVGLRVGVTDLLMGFASRLGYEVLSIEPVRLRADGTEVDLHPGPHADPATWRSVRFTLRQGGRKVLLDYLSADLSDTGLARDPAMRAFIELAAANRTVFKAASHLPQHVQFSRLRGAVLARAPSVWQDETGIDYALLSDTFEVTLYGRYQRAHRLFAGGMNRTLADAYASRGDVRPLGFRVGYEKQSGSSVLIAVRNDATRQVALERRMEAIEKRVAAGLERYAARPRMVYLSRGLAQAAEESAYLDAVHARLVALAPMARRSAVISVMVDRNGVVRDASIDQGSGDRAADSRIGESVRRIDRLPAPPASVAQRGDVVVLTLRVPEISGRL